MTMIRRATSGSIKNVGEKEDSSMIVCKACSHVVFRENLAANGSCPYCHRDASKTLVKADIPDALTDDDDDADVIALRC